MLCDLVLGKKWGCAALLMFFSCVAFALTPQANLYTVKKRNYAAEPEPRRFSISGQDKAFLVEPSFASYTHFNPLGPQAVYTIEPYSQTEFLPRLGKWMAIMDLNSQPIYLLPRDAARQAQGGVTLVPAHWISLTNTQGQYIIEPINYIFIVYEAHKKPIELLHSVLGKVGFPGTASENHSGGYYAYIGDQLFGQLTTQAGEALTYSNNDFRFQNDHLRIFGPYSITIDKQAAYVFIGAISEESGLQSELARLPPQQLKLKLAEINKQNANYVYYANYGHHFVSFANARNNLAVALIKAGYSTYYSTLGNVVSTLGESTEDHDGKVYISIIK